MPWGDLFWAPCPGPSCGGVLNLTTMCARGCAQRLRDWNDLSVDVIERLGMVVTALPFVTLSDVRPSYARDTILMRGENMSTIQWGYPSAEGGENPYQGRSCAC